MTTTICPSILAQEYDAFLALLNLELPTTYNGWLKASSEEHAKRSAQGRVLQHVVIHPQEFADYCRSCGKNPDLTMLNAFAIVQHRRNTDLAR